MSKYRCPVCGAPHKQPAEHCRLCGQSMARADMVPVPSRSDQALAAERFGRKGLGAIILLGLALALGIGIGAIALGLGEGNDQIDAVRDAIPFLASDIEDGWIQFEDPAGVFQAETPGEPTAHTGGPPLTVEGETVRWAAPIGDDLDLAVGYTEGAGLSAGDAPTEALLAVATAYASTLGGAVEGEPRSFSFNGRPALDVRLGGLRLDDKRAFANIRLVLVDDEAVFTETTSLTEAPSQHRRVAGSVVIVADLAGGGG